MNKKTALRKNDTKAKRLRRLSVQIAGQLPEDIGDAEYVLAFAAKIAVLAYHGGGASEPKARLKLVR